MKRRNARPLRALLAASLALLASKSATAGPTIWDVAKNPELGQADKLLALAERSRVPAEDVLSDLTIHSRGVSEELNRQLNARAAALITIADGERMPDVRLLFLLGDALVHADEGYLEEGRQRLEQALEQAPDSPLAPDAWSSLALAAGKLRDHEAQREAYTQALSLEWRREWRANLLLNRGEAHMLAGDLKRSQLDYRRSIALTHSAMRQSLASWGLAVAMERDGDLPTALELARKAARYRFGPPSHLVVSLDLPSIFFTPEYEEHYYRALAAMADARAEEDPARARLLLQTASLLWSLYIDSARKDDGSWVENAQQHRSECRRQLESLTPDDTDPEPSMP